MTEYNTKMNDTDILRHLLNDVDIQNMLIDKYPNLLKEKTDEIDKYQVKKNKKDKYIHSPQDIFNTVYDSYLDTYQEIVKLITVTTKNRIISIVDIFKGSIDMCIISPREIIIKVLMKDNASAFIITHNHPSGDVSPSIEDINMTKIIKDASDLMKLKMIDHLIIGGKDFLSMKEEGYI